MEICRHGTIARKCETCEAWADAAELRAGAKRQLRVPIEQWVPAVRGERSDVHWERFAGEAG